MTVGGLLLFYAINGLRFIKLSAGPISGESESGQGATPSLEPSPQVIKESAGTDVDHVALFDSLQMPRRK
jgi:hypothetical protein